MNLYKLRTITCKGCNITITKRMPSSRMFCTLGCYRKSSKPHRKNGSVLNCKKCAKSIYRTIGRINRGKESFCSIDCHNSWQGRNKTWHICKICKKTFRWSPSRSKSYNIKYCSIPCRNSDPEVKNLLREMNQMQQELKPNKTEKLAYELLDKHGVEYFKQHIIDGKFCVDAFIPSISLVIQIDGDYWHGNPEKYLTLDKRQRRRIALDRSQDAYMKKHGYKILRIWASSLLKSPNTFTKQLMECLP